MSVARPASRGLFSRRVACPSTSGAAASPLISPCRSFHASPQLAKRRKPLHKSIKAEDLNLVNGRGREPWSDQKIDQFTAKKFPKYTPEEMAELRKIYTPAQIESVKAGEAAIDTRDLTIQGRLRVDPYRFKYLDDFSTIQPIIDKRARRQDPPDPMARFMNLDDFTKDLIEWADKFKVGEVTGTLKKLEDFAPEEFKKIPEKKWPRKVKTDVHQQYMAYLQVEAAKNKDGNATGGDLDLVGGGPTDADVLSYILQRSSMTDKGRTTNSSMAPALANKVPGVAGMYKAPPDPEDAGLDEEGVYQDLKARTGMSVKQIVGLKKRLISHRFVSNQTRLGKIQKIALAFIVGNDDGWIGMGQASAVEREDSMHTAVLRAISNMSPIPRYENRTIYGNSEAKVGGTVIRLFNRPPGFGLRVPHQIFEIARAAGIRDLAAKIPRSRSSLNTAKATIAALHNQRNPDEIAMGRGKKLVDLRRVYYGGEVH